MKKTPFELERDRRVAENNRRLAELGVVQAALDLAALKPAPKVRRHTKVTAPAARSSPPVLRPRSKRCYAEAEAEVSMSDGSVTDPELEAGMSDTDDEGHTHAVAKQPKPADDALELKQLLRKAIPNLNPNTEDELVQKLLQKELTAGMFTPGRCVTAAILSIHLLRGICPSMNSLCQPGGTVTCRDALP